MATACLPNNELVMTQQLLANMLGVKQPIVSEAERKLEADGLIRYADGRITVLNRSGLELASCECNLAVNAGYACLLPAREAA